MPNINRRVLPGFSLTMGYTLFYLSLLVLIPVAGVFLRSASLSWSEFLQAAWSERARAAYKLTFGTAFVAAVLARHAATFPEMKLFAITDIGKDWDDVHKQLVADDGVFDRVYKPQK